MVTVARVSLFILLFAFTILRECGEVAGTRNRSRYLLQRLRNRFGSRSIVSTARRTYWYCRRGAKLAICRRNKRRLHSPTRSAVRSEPRASSIASCEDSGCSKGKCESGRCRCFKGWTGRRCNVDVNECFRKQHTCAHACRNTPGSYRCICQPAHKLSANGRTCTETFASRGSPRTRSAMLNVAMLSHRSTAKLSKVRRLQNASIPLKQNRYRSVASLYLPTRLKQKTCRSGCRYRCAVRNGAEECICPRGFSLAQDGRSCIDRNECLDAIGPVCPTNQQCVNTFGSFACRCTTGYVLIHKLSGKACEDANECLTGKHECGANAFCINTAGSYACTCLAGYQKYDSQCVPVRHNQLEYRGTSPRNQQVYSYPWSQRRKGYSGPLDSEE